MLHRALSDFLGCIEQEILRCEGIYVERYTEEILTSERVNLRIRIRSSSGKLLEVNEAIIVANNQLLTLDYRYHCQDRENHLIFRYDNTPHFPALGSFPHHKHLPESVIACNKPEFKVVLDEFMSE